MSALPGCDLASAFTDHNPPETWPRAVNGWNFIAQWLMAAATTEETASLNLHYDGIQRRHMLISLRDVQIRYEPYFNGLEMHKFDKAFLVLQNRQVQKVVGDRTFATQSDVAKHLTQITAEIAAMMRDPAVKSVSVSARDPLNHLSQYAAHEVLPASCFFWDQKPSYNMDGQHF